MRTYYVVGGSVCLMILAVFTDNGGLFPRWIIGSLWITLAYCFSKLALPPETTPSLKPKKTREVYHNSPRPSAARSASNSTEFSRNFCRQLYQGVQAWKKENAFKSWGHVEAVEIFDEFSAALDKHLDEFPDEAYESEVQQWIAYATEIRRNRD
ncbi:MAG: hypothetical protein AAB391_02715 [Patescibacteria group bacterium]